MANQSSVRDALEKTAASALNPVLSAAPAIVRQANDQIIARSVICGPPERRARE
jgi:hypothetical protein